MAYYPDPMDKLSRMRHYHFDALGNESPVPIHDGFTFSATRRPQYFPYSDFVPATQLAGHGPIVSSYSQARLGNPLALVDAIALSEHEIPLHYDLF